MTMPTLLNTLRRCVFFAALLSLFSLLGSCGQTGPLYLPDDSGSSETFGAESAGSENSSKPMD